MFLGSDEKHFVRLLGRNEVVLFLGAGFSADAKNKIGEKFPLGWELGVKLWKFLGYNGDYDNTPLPVLYQAFVKAGIKRSQKTDFLEQNLMAGEIPEFYNGMTIPYWYKIYSINIDDLVQSVYRRKVKRVRELVYPKDEYKERDQSLFETSLIHLHGKLPCNPEDIVFSSKQYARSGLKHQPLYSQFVYDYATHSTVFIGTDLDEPLFERYIEAREGRGGYGEHRPKSYIITPSISPVKAQVLKDEYNVHHIVGTAKDFLAWVESIQDSLPGRDEILKRTFPNLLSFQKYASLDLVSKKGLQDFAESIKRVPTDYQVRKERSAFLLGTNPSWNDIHNNLDIQRTIGGELYTELFEQVTDKSGSHKQKVVSLLGTAGSGKSTILKRVGLDLSRNGITVFISEGSYIPRINHIVDVLMAINERVVIVFDNATNMLGLIPNMVKAFTVLDKPPILVIGLRKNQRSKLEFYMDPATIVHKNYDIPDLDDDEITSLIGRLDQNNLLSKLKGMSDIQRFKEFKVRAKKQILVAMKEATNGIPFNQIIQSEFDDIEPYEAKVLCLCVALNTELGFANSKQDFVGFSEATHSETLDYLHNVLDGTIQWVGERGEFMIRHRILADFMIKHCSSHEMLKIAYVRVLSVLAPELVGDEGYSKKFNLYKSLINHQILYRRFQGNIDLAREVYDSLTPYFDKDAHFWLQYGSLELEGKVGNLILAENYINQAESLAPSYGYVQNAKCNLYYKMATAQDSITHAMDYKEKADALYSELMTGDGKRDPHVAHIHCRGNYYFIMKWSGSFEEKKTQLKELRTKITNAATTFPRDHKLDQALHAITRAYLNLGSSDPSITNPEILD